MDKYDLFLGCHQLRNDLFILKGLLGTDLTDDFSKFIDDHKYFFIDCADWDEEACKAAFLSLRKYLVAECHETIHGSFLKNCPSFERSIKTHSETGRLYEMVTQEVDSAEFNPLNLHSIIEHINAIERNILHYIAAPYK